MVSAFTLLKPNEQNSPPPFARTQAVKELAPRVFFLNKPGQLTLPHSPSCSREVRTSLGTEASETGSGVGRRARDLKRGGAQGGREVFGGRGARRLPSPNRRGIGGGEAWEEAVIPVGGVFAEEVWVTCSPRAFAGVGGKAWALENPCTLRPVYPARGGVGGGRALGEGARGDARALRTSGTPQHRVKTRERPQR